MKKKISLFFLAAFLCTIGAFAQVPYYGSPFYKEGFDYATSTLPTRGWVQSGVSYNLSMVGTHTDSAFKTTNSYSPSGKNFVNADPASTYSLLCTIPANTGLVDTLTSPVIVNTDTNFLCVGFSIFDPATSFPAGYGYMSFQISKDNGVTWDEAWRTDGASTGFNYTETAIPITFAGWKNVRINLNASYKNQNLKVRFCVNSPAARETPTQPMNLLIDGLFISPLRTIDATLKAVNKFSATAINNNGAYFQTPITIKILNSGTNPMPSINVGYKVSATGQPDQNVAETYTLTTPLQSGDTTSYTFTTKANLSARRTVYSLKAFTNLTGEQYRMDDTLSYSIENLTTDVPYKAEWLKSGVPADEWVVIQAGTGGSYPTWTQTVINNDSASYCNASTKSIDANSYYFSRPVFLRSGRTYELKFTTVTGSDNANDTNTMQVFWASALDTNALMGNALFNKTNINNTAVTYTLYVSPAQDSAYYFVFRALCKAGNKPLYIYDVAVKETKNVDAQIIDIVSPVTKPYRYTNNEPVTIIVGNSGRNTIQSGDLKVYYQFENNAPVETILTRSFLQGENTTYTFPQHINMTALRSYNLKIGVSLANDEDMSNNMVNLELAPEVVELPYNGSLGTNLNNRTYEEKYWTSVSTTARKWEIVTGASEVYWSFGHAGMGNTTATASLYSRPIHMSQGDICVLNYLVARNTTSKDLPLEVGIYQKINDTLQRISLVCDTVIRTNANQYVQYENTYAAAAEGDYYVGFVVKAVSINNKIFMKEANFGIVGDVGVAQIVSPLFINNCSATTSIKVKVQNYGSNAIHTLPVSYSINNGTPVVETITFSPALGANQSYEYTFAQTADMSAATNYTLNAYTQLFGDINLTNDTASTAILYVPYMQYGNIANPVIASPDTTSSGGTTIGLLNDGSLFTAYWHNTEIGRYNLYVQFLDPRGVPQWQNDLLISNNRNSSSVIYDATIDKQSNFVLGFTNMSEATGEIGEIRVSKVNKNGEYLFGPNGVVVVGSGAIKSCSKIITNSRGDIYLATRTAGLENNNLYKIDGTTGVIITSIACNVSSIEIDENDNLYVAYQDVADELKLQVYTSDLVPVHSAPAIITSSGVNTGSGAALSIIKLDKSGGAWVCYYSQSMYNNTYFVQYVDSNFVSQIGTSGVPVSTNTSRHRNNGWPVVMDDEGVLAFAFSETTAGGTAIDYMKGQKITKTGTLLMSTEGTNILTPIQGAATLDVKGLYYHNSQLVLNYNYWGGVGSPLRLNSALAFYNNNFADSTIINYASNNFDPKSYKTASDNYGVYSAWIYQPAGTETPSIVAAQHAYFDKTLANKSVLVKVKSQNDTMGYVTGGGLLNINDTAIVNAVPVPGYEFVEWQIGTNTVATTSMYKFAVSQNVTLTAIFRELPTYVIAATATAGGVITPSGNVEVHKGMNKIFTFTANAGYKLLEVFVDGMNDTNAVNNRCYTFENVTQPHTIHAKFQELSIDLLKNSDEKNIIAITPNPVKAGEAFTLQNKLGNSNLIGATIKIFAMNGLLINTSTLNYEAKLIAPKSQGIYLLQIITKDGGSKQLKLVVIQ